ETVARRGYRFIAPVSEVHGDDRDLIVENRTRVRVVIKEEKEERELVIRAHEAPISSSVSKSQRRVFVGFALVGLFLAVIVVSAYWFAPRLRQPQANATAPIIHSIAVLPFKPAGAGETDQYLGLA